MRYFEIICESEKSYKAWFNSRTESLIQVPLGWHHSGFIQHHPTQFNFDAVMGYSAEVYFHHYEESGILPPDYDDLIINKYVAAGWARLTFNLGYDRAYYAIFSVESATAMIAVGAIRAAIKHLLPIQPLIANRKEIFLALDSSEVKLDSLQAEMFLRTGRVPGNAKRLDKLDEFRNEIEARRTIDQSRDQLVSTPAFKNWFKTSKVVDGQQRPLIVYHGTSQNFAMFNREHAREGFYFTARRQQANIYATKRGDGGHVVPVYLSLQNPAPFRDYMRAAADGWTEATYVMQRLGYDGVIMEDDGVFNFIVFNANQIKSAIGNRGTYDPNADDITD
jgi:hypothetical protein